jgi:NADPH:quinone reductase-like Zn-dependent oxidoreductase
MRVVRFYELGGPEVLRIEELETPAPGPGHVRIRVKALGLNRADVMFRTGHYIEKAVLPSRLGYEASGVVDAVGDGVTEFQPGDAVSVIPPIGLSRYGTYGDVAVLPEEFVVSKPDRLTFCEAAASWMQYVTAYGALIEVARLQRGDHVLISAATSSVGLAAIQIANYVGAIPIATTLSTQQKKAVVEMGARHVIATQEESLSECLADIVDDRGIRVVFDAVGGPQVIDLANAMSPEGILLAHGALSPEPTPFPLKAAIRKSLTMRGYVFTEVVDNPEKLARAKRFILAGLESGELRPVIAKTFSFEDIVEAHRYLESNQQIGKIVVTL